MVLSSICKLEILIPTFINQAKIMFPYFNRHNKKRLIQSRVNVLAITESRAFHPGTASSQVSMAGIYLSVELRCTKSHTKTSRIVPDV